MLNAEVGESEHHLGLGYGVLVNPLGCASSAVCFDGLREVVGREVHLLGVEDDVAFFDVVFGEELHELLEDEFGALRFAFVGDVGGVDFDG